MPCSYLCVILCLFTILKCVFPDFQDSQDNSLERKHFNQRYIVIEEKTFPYTLVFMIFFIIVFLLGLTKGIVGLVCSRRVGMFGLNLLLDLPHPINHYYEPQLCNKKVIYDSMGWPIHPVTKQRVRIINESSELCINTVFFFVFPFFVLWVVIQNFCHCFEICDEESNGYQGLPTDTVVHDIYSAPCLDEKTSLRVPSCSSYCITEDQKDKNSKGKGKTKLDTYKDDNDTTEEKDTKYVLEQLTKSEDCLKQGLVKSDSRKNCDYGGKYKKKTNQ